MWLKGGCFLVCNWEWSCQQVYMYGVGCCFLLLYPVHAILIPWKTEHSYLSRLVSIDRSLSNFPVLSLLLLYDFLFLTHLYTRSVWKVSARQELVSPPHMIKLFWSQPMASWASGARWKVLGLAYNWRETQVKRPLGRKPDSRWSHRQTSVKLSWSQPVDPWTEQQHTCMLPPMSIEP